MFPRISEVESLPFHPAVVHLPLALAMLVPLFVLGALWAIRSGKAPATAWVLVVGLQALLVGGAVVALRTGEHEDWRLDGVFDGARLDAHRVAAQQFAVAAGVVLALAVGGLVAGRARPRFRAVATRGTLVMSLVVAGLALRAGYRGEELVYGAGGPGLAEVAGGDRDSEDEDDPDDDQDEARESFRERMQREREDDEDDRDQALARMHARWQDADKDCDHADQDDDDDRDDDDD